MQGKSTDRLSHAHNNPLLRESWFRSELYGLERNAEDFPLLGQGELADRLASHSGLQRYASPTVNHLAENLTATQSVVVLTDASGIVLQTVGNLSAMEKAQRFALSPGTLWSESGRGTNAIGTALAIDDSCEIDGEQHFLTSNQNLYCAAVPLQTPDGQIAGVLDISGPAHFSHTHTLAWVKSAARQIEYLWVKQSLHPQQWLMSLHPDPQKLDSVEELLLVFSDNTLIAANRLALRRLGIDAGRLGQMTFGQLFPLLKQTASTVPVPVTCNAQTYFYRLRAPAQSLVSVPPKPAVAWPFSLQQEGEKMVRLLNAGVSLCVQGETGSGKEFVSQTLHQHSRWREGKFIAINCAAIPESLIESELFGYQPGAFTGANKNGYIGKIREADGGILFLDEIGDMPLALQTRLLRVLQDKVVAPLGSSRSWPVNFAVICATHRNLTQLVANGEFREDLLYRLQEFTLTLPPLREWPMLPAFIDQQWLLLGGQARHITLSPSLLDTLAHFAWPGNIRQLRSLMKVLLALAEDGETLGVETLPAEYRQAIPELTDNLKQHDTALITSTLARFNGNISKAAQALGVARSTLYRRAARTRDGN
ncbi:sigma-54-dependent Fis family transcriptional regulator [Scandinavium sp. NPDC088450]|uniref:sigma-54-dependent Fis family transcriptional regulator n=1 Tax=Scandinavium sp. NPDC088450 TaxID=3364514 RepID=UPI00384BDDAB